MHPYIYILNQHIIVSPPTHTLTYGIDSLVDVPCFKCLIHKLVNPYSCHPETCSNMELWLLTLIVEQKTNITGQDTKVEVITQNVAPKL